MFNKSSAVAEMGDRLATIFMGRKVGKRFCAPFGRAGSPYNNVSSAEAFLHAKWHLIHPTTIHQRHRQDRQDRQWSDSIGRTVLQTVARKLGPHVTQCRLG